MTLREATATVKALLGEYDLVTFQATSTINGNKETLDVTWYASTRHELGYSKSFASVEAAVADAVHSITGVAVVPTADVRVE